MKYLKKLLCTVTLMCIFGAIMTVSAFASDLVVTIDAGHGGSDRGASCSYKGKTAYEKNMNLTIAKAMKYELETYKDVTVYMTRTGDSTLDLYERVAIAKRHKSDLLISAHNNSVGDAQSYTSGSSVLVSSGQYRPELGKLEAKMGNLILSELQNQVGTTNRGLLKRLSSSSKYPNGKAADYYGLIRSGTQNGIPTMIVEHAFVDSASDYNKFLSSDSKLTALGKADATGIAKYYGLVKKDSSSSYTTSGLDGRMISKHWMIKDGQKYYVRTNGTLIKNAWRTISGNTYYFTSTGAVATGLQTYSSGEKTGTYYFLSSGRMKTGWVKVNGDWYYFDSTGKAVTDCKKTIGSTEYEFNAQGVCTNR